jgi:FixJ family two-component response regulator
MLTQRAVVAVIDDNPEIVDAIDSLLSAHGYGTELYASAEAFREAASKSQAVCLIVDVQLGDSCGIDLIRELLKTGFNFPVIYITGIDNEPAKRSAEEIGCVAFLRKPFPAADLITSVVEAINPQRSTA